jgi:hypothetical protein
MYQVPQPDGRRKGVVFYRLHHEDLPLADCKSIVRTIATSFAQANAYTVCAGFRQDESGFYWVGFNHDSCGGSFEGALRAVTRTGVHLRVARRPRLPGDNPNPDLKPVLQPGEIVRLHAEYRVADDERPPAPAPKEKAPPRSLAETMRAARQELGGTGLAERFRRGARGRGRRGRSDQDGDQQA